MVTSTHVCTATAPAKLIISGEYSVIYGAPAIVVAINKYVSTTIRPYKINNETFADDFFVHFNLNNLKYSRSHSLKKMTLLKKQIYQNYIDFTKDQCSIEKVISKPFQLIQYVVANLVEIVPIQISGNLEILVNSSVPIGSGLGSSAACIISCLHAILKFFNIKIAAYKLLSMAIDIENLQHGCSSGIDLYTSMFGGCNYFPQEYKNIFINNHRDHIIENINLSGIDFQIVNTGKPLASTGECISLVKKHLISSNLIKDFSKVTLELKKALLSNNKAAFVVAIRTNHALLCQIGVVPEKIKILIKKIENIGGAGKICGAGSIYGDHSGIIMLVGDRDKIHKIIMEYGFFLEDVVIDYSGVTVV